MASSVDLVPDLSLPEDGEGDVCRVCRAEGEEGMPLIYPCKCSGSVRYVHADCLKSWLAHSQKRYCEICGYKYAFTKVYPEDVPTTIPFIVYIRQSVMAFTRAASLLLRFVLVVVSWLISLPVIEMFVLKGGIYFTDNITEPTEGEGQTLNGTSSNATLLNNTIGLNSTLVDMDATNTSSSHLPWATRVLLHIQSRVGSHYTFPGFVFRGQILSISIAGFLLIIMLLREWYIHHNWTEHLNPKPKSPIQDINPDDYMITCGIAFKKSEKKEANEFVDELVADGKDDKRTAYRVRAARDGRRWREKRGRDVMVGMAEDAQRRRADGSEQAKERSTMTLTKQEIWARDLQKAVQATTGVSETTTGSTIEGNTATEDPSEKVYVGFDAIAKKFAEIMPDFPFDAKTTAGMPTAGSSSKANTFGSTTTPEKAGPSQSPSSPTSGPVAESSLQSGSSSTSPPLLSPDSGLPRPADIARTPSLAYKAPEMLSEKAKGKRREEAGDSVLGKPPNSEKEDEVTAQTPDDNGRVNGEILLGVAEESHDEEGWEDMPDGEEQDIIIFPPGDPGGTDSHQGGDVPLSPTHSDSTLPNSYPHTPLEVPELLPIPQVPNAFLNAPGLRDLPPQEQRAILDEARRLGLEHAGDRGGGDRGGPPRDDAELQVDFVDEDFDEPFDREDWDGILEIIGLIGPITNLIQNVIFASVIIAGAQIILIGLPMICGKLFLCTDVIGLTLWFIRNILRAIRLVTNPIIDVTLEIVRDVVFKPALSSARGLEGVIARKMGITIPSTPYFSFSHLTSSSESATNSTLSNVLSAISTKIQDGNSGYRCLSQLIPAPASTSGHILCVLAGYTLAAGVITLTILANKIGLIDYTWGFLRGEARQYVLFGKLAFFMAVELVVFPLDIGVVLAGCVAPVFEGGSLVNLLGMFKERVFGGVFLAWLTGTMFMFSFATFLSYIRGICRPGALYFIRDPSDPSYSPVKDIIDRPTASQARKLWSSGILYTTVVFWLIGATCWGLSKQGFVDVLPLRYKGYSPISSVPFDILFLYLVIPPTLASLRVIHRGKKLLAIWWFHTASLFRIGPLLLMNPRHDSPSLDPPYLAGLWPILDPIFQVFFGKYTPQATYMRVPSSDRVALLPTTQRRREGVFIPLNDIGEPRTDLIKKALIRQDLRAVEQGRIAKDDYTIVWMPAYWRTRLHVFIGCAVTTCAAVIGWGFFGAILVGRAVWGMVLDEKVHDGYSFVVGWYVILGAFWLGRDVGRYIARMNRAPRIRRSMPSMRTKRMILVMLSDLYSLGMVFGVTPLLTGLVWDLYVTVPGKYGYKGEGRPVIHVWDAWAMGLVLLSLQAGIIGLLTRQRRGRLPRRLADLRVCIRHPLGRKFQETNRIMLPILGFLGAQILVPQLLTFVLYLIVPPADHVIAGLSRTMYVHYLVVLLVFGGRGWIAKKWEVVRQAMIDREYVLEERVENYEPEEVVEIVSEEVKHSTTALGEDGIVEEDDGVESPDDVDVEEESDGASGGNTPAKGQGVDNGLMSREEEETREDAAVANNTDEGSYPEE